MYTNPEERKPGRVLVEKQAKPNGILKRGQ